MGCHFKTNLSLFLSLSLSLCLSPPSSKVLVCSENKSFLCLTTQQSHVQTGCREVSALAGNMWFIPSVQLFCSPHNPDASVYLLMRSYNGRFRKWKVDVCMRGWLLLLLLLSPLLTGSYWCPTASVHMLPVHVVRGKFSFWTHFHLHPTFYAVFTLKVQKLIIGICGTKVVQTKEPVCLPSTWWMSEIYHLQDCFRQEGLILIYSQRSEGAWLIINVPALLL